MPPRHPNDWMWADALEMLARTERLHRQMFQPAPARPVGWEPPVDVLETPGELVVIAARPGVPETAIDAAIDGGVLVITGVRTLPPQVRVSAIHRMELPQGRFERRVALPPGRYDQIRRSSVDGCLYITLRKSV